MHISPHCLFIVPAITEPETTGEVAGVSTSLQDEDQSDETNKASNTTVQTEGGMTPVYCGRTDILARHFLPIKGTKSLSASLVLSASIFSRP